MDFKKFLPHLLAAAILFALSCVFFAPIVFSGKALPQSDNIQAKGMQTEVQKYLKETGEAPLWTNSAFGGMPAYQIYQPTKTNLTKPVFYAFLLGNGVTVPYTAIFLAMMSLYLLLLAFKTDWRVALVGAATFGISVYNVDILEAGHSTKMIALALLPGIFAGAIWAYRGRYLLGGGVAALFMCLEMLANHVQISYYGMLVLGLLFIAELIESVQKKHVGQWAIATATIVFALIIGAASNANRLLPTEEFSQETIRGKSELAAKASKGDGLDKTYMFDWSYGILESMTLLVPHFAGGGSNESMKGTETYNQIFPAIVQNMTQQGYPNAQARQQADRQVTGLFYNGSQPFVGTAIYFGAALLFLFFVGAFLVQGPEKWWLISATALCIFLAWGKYFFLNDIFYEILPLFKKFRAVTMALGVGQLMVCLLAALGLQKIFDSDITIEKRKKALTYALYAAGGLCLAAVLLSFVTNFSGANDEDFGKQNPQLLQTVLADRASLARLDAMRSLAFIAAAFGILFFYLNGRFKSIVAVSAIGLITLADVWLVCTRTLNATKYESEKTASTDPKPTPSDQKIWDLEKNTLHYRVLDFSRGGITGNAYSSYFHKSLSGYSAAKMALYQDVVEKYLNKGTGGQNARIMGLLNTKYILATVKNEPIVQPNPFALGNAWFVKTIETVANADDELDRLGTLQNMKDTLFVQTKNATQLDGWKYAGDSTDQIKLTAYYPDKMVYEYSAKTESVAAFSEIYYPHEKGWNCYLNGQLMPNQIFKADYFIRALRLPAGEKQTLEMRFEPKSVKIGGTISMITSAMALLFFVVGLFFHFKNEGFGEANQLSEVAVSQKEKQTVVQDKKKKK